MTTSSQLFLLAVDAHRTAQDHGFWEAQTSRNPVATKVALIHTEIEEFRAALAGDGDPAEELADVLIRALDLAVAVDVRVSAYARIVTDPPPSPGALLGLDDGSAEDAAVLRLHAAASRITTHDRRPGEDALAAEALIGLIQSAFDAASDLGIDTLPAAMRAKMERNRSRPRLHGRKY